MKLKFQWLGLSRAIHPAGNKHTANQSIVPLTGFKEVSIPLDMQVGPGCKPTVVKGDHVNIGDLIGEPLGPWSVPVHASVSGKVTKIEKQILSDGEKTEYVTIESDGKNTVSESLAPPIVTDKESFLKAVRDAGLVGLGGAAFPTHIKLNPPPGKTVDTLIVNAAECEPYITTDHRIALDYADDVIYGALVTAHWCSIDSVIIGTEDNKKDAARSLEEAAKRAKEGECSSYWPKNGVTVKVLPTSYPTGAEKVLIHLLMDRVVPEGGLPADVGVIVQNITTLCVLAQSLKTGMPLVKKAITLDGSAVKKPGNYEVPIGAPIRDVIECAGGTVSEPAKIIMGGPMMGVAVDDISRPILKNNNAILIFDEKEAKLPKESACISCGRCLRACPMRLQPMKLDKAARAINPNELEELHVMNCIECGSCTYVCPAKRYLVQNIRNGKAYVRAEAQAAKENAKKGDSN